MSAAAWVNDNATSDVISEASSRDLRRKGRIPWLHHTRLIVACDVAETAPTQAAAVRRVFRWLCQEVAHA